MEVILKEDVANVGFRGEVVKVADGYARNLSFAAQAGHAGHRGQQGRDRADEGRPPRGALPPKKRRPRSWRPGSSPWC